MGDRPGRGDLCGERVGLRVLRDWPNDAFDPTDLRVWVVIGVFLLVTLMANATLAGSPGPERLEADARRCEADLSAERQAALRRVATAVAQGVPPNDVFSTVTAELAHALRSQHAALFRYEPDGAPPCWSRPTTSPVCSRCRSASVSCSMGTTSRRECCARGRTAPIVVDGRKWEAWPW